MKTAIVGAGVIGKAIALEFIKRGVACTIFDPIGGTNHSASRCAGAIQGAFSEITAENENSEVVQFGIKSQKKFRTWLDYIEQLSGKSVATTAGTIVFSNHTSRGSDKPAITAMRNQLDLHGYGYENLSSKDVGFLKPNLSYSVDEVLYIPHEDSVEADDLHEAMFAGIEKSKCAKIVHSAVKKVTALPEGKWQVSFTKDEQIFTEIFERVILTAGAQSKSILDEAVFSELDLPLQYAGKGTAFIVDNVKNIDKIVRTPNRQGACGVHVVPRRNSKLYVGATNRPTLEPSVEPGAVTGELEYLFDGLVSQLNIAYASAEIRELRSANRPFVVDGKPLVGQTKLEGLLIASGTGRVGILMAHDIANIIADEVQGITTKVYNPFAPHRSVEIKPAYLATLDEIEEVVRVAIFDLVEPVGKLPNESHSVISSMIAVNMHSFIMKIMKGEVPGQAPSLIVRKCSIATAVPLLYKYVK
ncbi:FAD-dependent oxidoreductase [Pseudomonas alliivorans]|nr:FAD-dependent oxidoreductase [Pseudomonas alliivorans]